MAEDQDRSTVPDTRAQFSTTQWTVVLNAREPSSPEAQTALSQLCQTYWPPLYGFIRRRGHAAHQAQDFTQAFFVHLFSRDALQTVRRERGKFRSFLLTALSNFLNNEWDRQQALKRGGGMVHVSWDAAQAESFFGSEPTDQANPQAAFDRAWAHTVARAALNRLAKQFQARQASVYAALEPYLTCEPEPGVYEELAGRLGKTTGNLRTILHRMRRQFGEFLREAVIQTVARPEDVDEELRYLLAVLGS